MQSHWVNDKTLHSGSHYGAHQSKVSLKAADEDKTGICNILVDEQGEECKSFQRRAVAKPLDEANTVRDGTTECKHDDVHTSLFASY